MKHPVSLSWDHLHEQSRAELLDGAGFRQELAKQTGAALDEWIKRELQDSLVERSKGALRLLFREGAQEHAWSVRAIKLSVSDPLKEAKAILTEALCHNPQHDEDCEARRFAEHKSYLPANHPAWKSAPACTCWVGRLAGWLKNNSEI